MTLQRGARLGVLEITGELGAGGMGAVYRARDVGSGRDVAVKILPAEFAADPERMKRFDREARVLASLHHPNIAEMLEVLDSGPQHVLVMELVEGPTLAERLAQGPLAREEALAVAQQVAAGLEYAHAQGIVHRDLKPANIKIRPDGVVKILDFGLARAVGRDTALTDASGAALEITDLATRAGVILGTATYMSPEQARGKPVDRRADIWAFGCVLYEMLAGRRVFEGETMSDTLAATLTADPDWSALPAETGPRLRLLLRRCLAKDPQQRLHAIADARLEIEEALTAGAGEIGAEAEAGQRRAQGASRRGRFAWASLGVTLAALGVVGLGLSGVWRHFRAPAARPLRLSVVPTDEKDVGFAKISPDGRRIAYKANRAGETSMIWVRDLESFSARPLAGTENAGHPFWSPDSNEVGFFAGGVLKRVPADGGPVQVVSKVTADNAAWGADGTILLSGNPLRRVPATGGEPTPVARFPYEAWKLGAPAFLPDGRRFLFTASTESHERETAPQGIYLGSLDSSEIRRLLPDVSRAAYAPPGYIVFVRDGKLTAIPFDLGAGVVSGSPAPLGEGLEVSGGAIGADFSVADDGTVALVRAGTYRFYTDRELRLVDREGRVLRAAPRQQYMYQMDLAPDGKRAIVQIHDPITNTNNLWRLDLAAGARFPLVETRGYTAAPLFSPDGARVAFTYSQPGAGDAIFLKDFRTGAVSPIGETAKGGGIQAVAWSHDGRHLLFIRFAGKDKNALFLWSSTSRTSTLFTNDFSSILAAFSPDDRYLVYTTGDQGFCTVRVTTFPDRKKTWTVATAAGFMYPISWRADGREILVATPEGHIAAYPVSTEGEFSVGEPTILVRDLEYMNAPYSRATADHSRILIRVELNPPKDMGEIRLVFEWAAALKSGRR